jgi:hypothetical protein
MKPRLLAVLGLSVLVGIPETALPQVATSAKPETATSRAPATTTSLDLFATPEDRVAAMVREALKAPKEDQSWACLEQALFEMNASAEQGRGDNSPAKRVADTLNCPSVLFASSSATIQTRSGGHQRASAVMGLLTGAWQRINPFIRKWNILLETRPWLPPGLMILAGMGLLWLGRQSVRRPISGPDRDRRIRRRTQRLKAQEPRWSETPEALALALWQGGLPSMEISRRTGLAQDAVSVLLTLNGKEAILPNSPFEKVDPANPYLPMDSESAYARAGSERT